MANLRGIAIILLLLLSSFIVLHDSDDSADDSENLDEQVVSRADEKPISQSHSRQSTTRPPQDDAHGGSWLDSFEDESGVDWGRSDHLNISEGKAAIKLSQFALDSYTLGLYHFNEGSGSTANDETTNNYDGTINGAGWVNGKFGKALIYDGIDDYVSFGDTFDPDNNDMSFQFWIKTTQSSRYDIDKRLGSAGEDSYGIIIIFNLNNEDTHQFRIGNEIINYNFDLNDGIWHCINLIRDTNKNKLIVNIDGLVIKEQSVTIGNVQNSANFIIGKDYENNFYFNGVLDEFRVSNKARISVKTSANLTSKRINLPEKMQWDTIIINKDQPSYSYLNITILNAVDGEQIPGTPIYTAENEFDISFINSSLYPSIRLKAHFTGNNFGLTPSLNFWGVSWNASNSSQDTFFGGEKVESSDNVEAVDGDVQLEHGGIDESAVAVWHFDEGTGPTAFDETDNDNDGTINGVTWTNGKYGKALSFDGVDDYVDVSSVGSQFSSGNAFTIVAWFKTTSTVFSDGRENVLFSAHNNGNNVYRLTIPDGRIDSYEDVNSVGRETIGSRGTWNDGAWHHIAFVYPGNGSDERAYVDGSLQTDDFANNDQIDWDQVNQVQVGMEWDGASRSDFFNGIIDEVTIWDRTLSAQEIADIYQYGPYSYQFQGNLTSKPIPLPTNMCWDTLRINKTEPQDTSVNITILDGITNQPIPSFQNLTGTQINIRSINPVTHNTIRLHAAFSSNGLNTSILHDWSVSWLENSMPRIINITSVPIVNRTKSAQITINLSDLEDSEENLTLKVEYKSPYDTTWQTEFLVEACYTIDQWNCTFIPLKYADLGYYSFRFTVKDTFLSQNITTYPDLIEVINNKPTPPEVSILPTEPKTIDHLTVIAKNSTDIETSEEYLKYWYRWHINGSHLPIFDNKTIIPKEATKKYEHWHCVAFPFDGDELGLPGEAEVIIKNSPPKFKILFLAYEMDEDVPVVLEKKLLSMFSDQDNDNLTFTATGQNNIEVGITQENGTITLTPAPDWFGTEYITFYANDSSPFNAIQTVEVTVHPTNDLPKITQIGHQKVTEDSSDIGFVINQNEELQLRIVVDDPDGDVERGKIQFLFNKTETNNFYFQNSESKLIFQPNNTDVGRHYINISITDNNETPPIFISQEVWIDVLNVNDPPTVSITVPRDGWEFLETDIITFISEVDDPDLLIPQSNENFTYQWFTNKTSLGTLGTEQQIRVTGQTFPPGYYNITVMVEDTAGEKAYDSVEIIITGVPGKDTTEPKDTAADNYLWLWVLVVIIIIIVICILFFAINKKKKRKLEDLGIPSEQEVLKPEEAYKIEVSMATLAQASEATQAASQFEQPSIYQPQAIQPQPTIEGAPVVPGATQDVLPSEVSTTIAPTTPTIPTFAEAPQLPPAAEPTTPEPLTPPETPPETVTPTVEAPVMETGPEPTEELPPEAYVQPLQPTVAAPQPTVAPQVQPTSQPQVTPIPKPQTSHLTPDQPTTLPLTTPCPLCNQQIPEYSNPCPHCGGELEWG